MQAGKYRYQRFVLLGLILLLAVIIFKELHPYLGGFLGAFTLFILLKGIMVKLVERYKWRKGWSASAIVLGTTIFILIPLTGFGFLAADTISGISIDPAQILRTMREFSDNIEERIGIGLFTPENLSFVPRAGSTIMQSLVSGLSSMVINGIIAIFLLYFMLANYQSLEKITTEILPFSQENKQILREETKSIIQANAIGIPVVAITQGILAYVGYLFFGVSNPLVYAVLVACTTIIPVVGTSLVWASDRYFRTGSGRYRKRDIVACLWVAYHRRVGYHPPVCAAKKTGQYPPADHFLWRNHGVGDVRLLGYYFRSIIDFPVFTLFQYVPSRFYRRIDRTTTNHHERRRKRRNPFPKKTDKIILFKFRKLYGYN